MHKIKVEQFEGPLDLLLQLIEEQKLTITEVSLAEVTEQYIKILHTASKEQIKPDELADFLVVAARLLLLKSRALLPFLEWEDEEEEQLTSQLKIFKQYYEASKVIQAMVAKRTISFSREKLLTIQEVEFQPPQELSQSILAKIFAHVLHGLAPLVNLPTEMVRKTINIQEKINEIRRKIASSISTSFAEILKEAKDKTDVIVSFLALLELVKQEDVIVTQNNVFDDISIEPLK